MTQAGINSLSTRSVTWTVVHILVGAATIVISQYDSQDISAILGLLLLLTGASLFLHAAQTKNEGHMWWKVGVAALTVFFGFYISSRRHPGVAALAFTLTAFLIAQGLIGVAAYFQGRKLPGAVWVLFDAIVALILGDLVRRQWQSGSLRAIGTLVGISMITTGFVRVMLGMATKRAARSAAA